MKSSYIWPKDIQIKKKQNLYWRQIFLHINVLEIKAILFGRKAFFSDVWNSHFFIYSDNYGKHSK